MNDCKGLGFRKADLHVHTPASACFGNKSVTPEQIVETAIGMDLEVIAITDHNTVSAIDEIRRLALKKNLFVFPGIELSAREGHLLALFERDAPVCLLEDFLGTVGVAPEGRGDAGTFADKGMASVCQAIVERGGLSIAAHIERWPSGFLESNQSRSVKMKLHASSYLSALEITIPQNRGKWNTGMIRGFPKKYACIQGSDAHALSDIGRRPVYIRMEQVDLSALRDAFKQYEERIRFPDASSY